MVRSIMHPAWRVSGEHFFRGVLKTEVSPLLNAASHTTEAEEPLTTWAVVAVYLVGTGYRKYTQFAMCIHIA